VIFFSQRDVLFKENRQEVAPDTLGVRFLYPTCWTVCGDNFDSAVNIYAFLQDKFEQSKDEVTDTEINVALLVSVLR